MRITIESTFHANRTHTLTGITEGRNTVKAAAWMRDDGCDCGWTTNKTTTRWTAPDGYQITGVSMDPAGDIVFGVEKTGSHQQD